MVRVTRPGGRIVLGHCIPNNPAFVAQELKISLAFTYVSPEDFTSPMTRGVKAKLVERFQQANVPEEKIVMVEDTFMFRSPDLRTAEQIELFRKFFGPTVKAYEAAEKSGRVEELNNGSVKLAERRTLPKTEPHPFQQLSCV